MDTEIIYKVNNNTPENQGIFFQPYVIPVSIKEHVIYSRWKSGGTNRGYEDRFENKPPDDRHEILDVILGEVFPEISLLQYKRLQKLWKNCHNTEDEYYGDSTDWEINYIIVSEFENLLKSFGKVI